MGCSLFQGWADGHQGLSPIIPTHNYDQGVSYPTDMYPMIGADHKDVSLSSAHHHHILEGEHLNQSCNSENDVDRKPLLHI